VYQKGLPDVVKQKGTEALNHMISDQHHGRPLEIIPIILSAAKDLARRTQRSFAALRMTWRTPLEALTGNLISKCLTSRVKTS